MRASAVLRAAARDNAAVLTMTQPTAGFGQVRPSDRRASASAARIMASVLEVGLGEIVMEHLRQLDDVAYVRFASVYRNFREAKDFEAVLGELSAEDDARVATLRK